MSFAQHELLIVDIEIMYAQIMHALSPMFKTYLLLFVLFFITGRARAIMGINCY